jgi:hypothetical protein
MTGRALPGAKLAGLRPVRLSNADVQEDGGRIVEIVCDTDEVFVLMADARGGDMTTLTEPGRFSQTWARLRPELEGLAHEDGATGWPRHEIAVHLGDGAALRWVGHGKDNGVWAAMAAFGMNEERSHTRPVLTQVGPDHRGLTGTLGDWP